VPVTPARAALLRFAAFGAALALLSTAAAAAGPFGVGLPEPAPSGGGWFPEVFRTIAAWQSAFYRDLTATVRAMKTDGTAGLWLCAVSFAYGVVHAAGPGHGKAIVSAYVLANRETARNGAVLAMVSAFAQGCMAVAIVAVAALVLGATSMAMTRAAELMEIGSFALITGLGAWLVWRKILAPLAEAWRERFAPVVVMPGFGAMPVPTTFGHDHDHHRHDHGHHGHAHDHHHHGGHDHHHHGGHAHGGLACDCGHVHAPTPELAGGRLDWRKAWTAVAAVGLRPCTGALIVLVFSLAQGLFAAGVAATFAMALGTGLTVAMLTLLAVGARGLAVRVSGSADSAAAVRVHHALEGLGAVAVLGFGALMLGASLAG
jgi:nickel/cobalt exporter